MSYKIKTIIKGVSKIALPVIAECSEGFKVNKSLNEENIINEYSVSNFYQTAKMTCYSFYKPQYIKNKNDQ
ncbi:hypothetical protein SAMN05444355_11183 [Flavobacterium frigoris]|uniref:Uncharacterized protein n=1 Tax=Flavobacterium frigoris TaxID=229204 RepID=A0A1H9NSX2_FLAFI|nr:hypothetical protein SAMN05444355_11183 [Flavobacterium frigoris]